MNKLLKESNLENIVQRLWIASLFIFAVVTISSLTTHFTIHLYRQSQTVMTALYLPSEGFRFNYSTPIMGYPWAVPLEFPIYQWFAVLIQKIFGFDLVIAGKLINITGHIINNLLIIQIFRNYKIDRLIIFLGLIFYNVFPFYLIFDTTFLVDSLTLTLCFSAIYFLSRYLKDEKKVLNIAGFFLFALFTGVSKSTTFISVLSPIVALLLLQHLMEHGGFRKLFTYKNKPVRDIYLAGILFALAFTIMYAWVIYSDHIKMQNPLSAEWASANLWTWNFGSLTQRLSLVHWKGYFTNTMIYHPAFMLLAAAGIGGFVLYANRKEKLLGICFLLLFLAPPLIFFNLFYIHTYYSIANMLFLYFILSTIVTVLIRQKTLLIKNLGLGLAIVFLSFGCYRSFAFRNQVLKNEAEPGVYGQLNKLVFNPGMNDVIVVVYGSRDPYMEYFFKCRGINLSREEYDKYGRADRLKKLSGNLPIRMICIVDERELSVLPGDFNGILPDNIKHMSISNQPETPDYYNFFWY